MQTEFCGGFFYTVALMEIRSYLTQIFIADNSVKIAEQKKV